MESYPHGQILFGYRQGVWYRLFIDTRRSWGKTRWKTDGTRDRTTDWWSSANECHSFRQNPRKDIIRSLQGDESIVSRCGKNLPTREQYTHEPFLTGGSDFDGSTVPLVSRRHSLIDGVQAVLEQLAHLGSHIGVVGTVEIFHESSDLSSISAATVNR